MASFPGADVPPHAVETSPAERVIARFGGIRPMAHKLSIPAATIQGWKKRGVIPAARLNELRLAAQRHFIRLDEADLEALRRADAHDESRRADAHDESRRADAPDEVRRANASEEPRRADAETVVRTSAPLLQTPPLASPRALPLPSLLVTRSDDSKATSSPGDAADTGKKRRSATSSAQWPRLAAAVTLVALVGLGATFLLPTWQAPNVATPIGVAVLERRIEALEGRIAQSLADQAGALATQAALLGRIDAVERSIPAINQKIAAMPLNAPLAMVLAAGQLRSALLSANPFQSELAAARVLHIGDDATRQAMDHVAGRASVGIAAEAWLTERFAILAPIIVRAGLNNADVSWLERTWGWVSLWLPRLGGPDVEGTSTRAIVARIEARLATGEFAKAVEQAGQLTDRAAEVAGPWLAEARARVAADHLRMLLTRQMIALLPQSGAK